MLIPYTVLEVIRECLSTINEKSEKELYSQKLSQEETIGGITLENGSGSLFLENGTNIVLE